MAFDKKEHMKAYRQTDAGKAYIKAYRQTDKFKAYRKTYKQSPESKAIAKARRQRPEAKAIRKERYQTDEYRKQRSFVLKSDPTRARQSYRRVAFKFLPLECANYGWKQVKSILQVHHIDSTKENGKKDDSVENLIILCPTCHAILTYKRGCLIERKIEIFKEYL